MQNKSSHNLMRVTFLVVTVLFSYVSFGYYLGRPQYVKPEVNPMAIHGGAGAVHHNNEKAEAGMLLAQTELLNNNFPEVSFEQAVAMAEDKPGFLDQLADDVWQVFAQANQGWNAPNSNQVFYVPGGADDDGQDPPPPCDDNGRPDDDHDNDNDAGPVDDDCDDKGGGGPNEGGDRYNEDPNCPDNKEPAMGKIYGYLDYQTDEGSEQFGANEIVLVTPIINTNKDAVSDVDSEFLGGDRWFFMDENRFSVDLRLETLFLADRDPRSVYTRVDCEYVGGDRGASHLYYFWPPEGDHGDLGIDPWQRVWENGHFPEEFFFPYDKCEDGIEIRDTYFEVEGQGAGILMINLWHDPLYEPGYGDGEALDPPLQLISESRHWTLHDRDPIQDFIFTHPSDGGVQRIGVPVGSELKFALEFFEPGDQSLSGGYWMAEMSDPFLGQLWDTDQDRIIDSGSNQWLTETHTLKNLSYIVGESGLNTLELSYRVPNPYTAKETVSLIKLEIVGYRMLGDFVTQAGEGLGEEVNTVALAGLVPAGEDLEADLLFECYARTRPGEFKKEEGGEAYDYSDISQMDSVGAGSKFSWRLLENPYGASLEEHETVVSDESYYSRVMMPNVMKARPKATDEENKYLIEVQLEDLRMHQFDHDYSVPFDKDDPQYRWQQWVEVLPGQPAHVGRIEFDKPSAPHDGKTEVKVTFSDIKDDHGNTVQDEEYLSGIDLEYSDRLGFIKEIEKGSDEHHLIVEDDQVEATFQVGIYDPDQWVRHGRNGKRFTLDPVDADMELNSQELVRGEHLVATVSFKSSQEPVAEGCPVTWISTAGHPIYMEEVTDKNGQAKVVFDTTTAIKNDGHLIVWAKSGSQVVVRYPVIKPAGELSVFMDHSILAGDLTEDEEGVYQVAGNIITKMRYAKANIELKGPPFSTVRVDMQATLPRARWTMDKMRHGITPDIWGGHHAEVIGASLSDDFIEGEASLYFDGNSQLIVRDLGALNLDQGFNALFHFKPLSDQQGELLRVDNLFSLSWSDEGRLVYVYETNEGLFSVKSEHRYPLDQWIRVRCHATSDVIVLQIDGDGKKEVLPLEISGQVLQNSQPLHIGNRADILIDDLKIYGRGQSPYFEISEEAANGSNEFELNDQGYRKLTLQSTGLAKEDGFYPHDIAFVLLDDDTEIQGEDDDDGSIFFKEDGRLFFDNGDPDSAVYKAFYAPTYRAFGFFAAFSEGVLFGSDEGEDENSVPPPDGREMSEQEMYTYMLHRVRYVGDKSSLPLSFIPGPEQAIEIVTLGKWSIAVFETLPDLKNASREEWIEFLSTEGVIGPLTVLGMAAPFLPLGKIAEELAEWIGKMIKKYRTFANVATICSRVTEWCKTFLRFCGEILLDQRPMVHGIGYGKARINVLKLLDEVEDTKTMTEFIGDQGVFLDHLAGCYRKKGQNPQFFTDAMKSIIADKPLLTQGKNAEHKLRAYVEGTRRFAKAIHFADKDIIADINSDPEKAWLAYRGLHRLLSMTDMRQPIKCVQILEDARQHFPSNYNVANFLVDIKSTFGKPDRAFPFAGGLRHFFTALNPNTNGNTRDAIFLLHAAKFDGKKIRRFRPFVRNENGKAIMSRGLMESVTGRITAAYLDVEAIQRAYGIYGMTRWGAAMLRHIEHVEGDKNKFVIRVPKGQKKLILEELKQHFSGWEQVGQFIRETHWPYFWN